jgi:hypothetical protein
VGTKRPSKDSYLIADPSVVDVSSYYICISASRHTACRVISGRPLIEIVGLHT